MVPRFVIKLCRQTLGKKLNRNMKVIVMGRKSPRKRKNQQKKAKVKRIVIMMKKTTMRNMTMNTMKRVRLLLKGKNQKLLHQVRNNQHLMLMLTK